MALKLQSALDYEAWWVVLKHRFLGPTLRVSDSTSLQWDPRMSISNELRKDADPASPGTTL